MRSWQRWGIRGLLGMGVWLVGAPSAWGQIISWINPSGGAFNTAANWSAGGPPAAGEFALYDLTNTYTITWSSNVNNSVANVRTGNVTWALSGQVYTLTNSVIVGDFAAFTGGLTAGNGTVSGSLICGSALGTSGNVTLNSDLEWNGNATVGSLGLGTLRLNSGSRMTGTGASIIGSGSAANGTVTVNSGAIWSPNSLIVGASGIGRLTISGGGLVESTNATTTDIGVGVVSLGEALVSGTGSHWQTSGGLQVGVGGLGRLTVSGGGTVNSVNPFGTAVSSIGTNVGSEGEVTITGTTSSWRAQTLNVGNSGQGLLTISSGGFVTSLDSTIGSTANGAGTVHLTGNNSRWESFGNFVVGSTGIGTVNVSAGAKLESNGATAVIGANAGGGNGNVNLDGAGTAWTSTGTVIVGQNGSGQLNIVNQATLGSVGGFIGRNVGSSGGVSLDGAGVLWTVGTTGLYLGGSNSAAGGSGTLTITNGASVTVDGETKIWATAGSALSLNGTLSTNSFTRLGTFSFTNGTLTMNGGIFTNGSAATPLSLSSSAGTAILKLMGGAQSTNVSALTLGTNGIGRLEINSGSDFFNTTASLASNLGSQGTVIVDGVGSTWTNTGTVNIGNFSQGTVAISNGGAVNGATLVVGTTNTGIGFLSLNNGTWTSSGPVTIGSSGQGTVSVAGGGFGSGTTLTLGNSSGAMGTLNLNGGTWNSSGSVIIGGAGTGIVNVNAGGSASSTTLVLGNTVGGSGTLNLVGGVWTASSTLSVGFNSAGAVNITNGGTLTTGTSQVGVLAGSTGNVIVTGAGSTWNSGTMTIGGVTTGTLQVQNGGTVNGTALNIASNGPNSSVMVDGADSRITLSNVLNIGLTGSGTMAITNSGLVSATTVMLGQTPTGNGTLTLSGAGSTLSASNGLYLGGSNAATGGTGTLTLNTGTVINAGPEFKIWNIGSSLNLNGGTINTTAFTRLGGFNFNAGNLNVNGGVFNNGTVATALTLNAGNVNDLVTLNLSGGATTSNIAALTVGNNRQGAMNLSSGAVMSSTSGVIGGTIAGTGNVSLSGLNTTWNITNGLTLGGGIGGTGTLSIGSGSTVNVGLNVIMSPLGTLNLDGGTLSTSGLGLSTGSVVNWSSGTINFTNNVGISDATLIALLGPSHTLTFGHTLSNTVGFTTTLNGNTMVDGGSIIGGTLANGGTLTLKSDIDLAGSFINNASRTTIVQGPTRLNASSGIVNNGEIQLATTASQLTGGTLTNAGTLRGTGIVDNTLQNTATGRIDVTTGNRLVFTNSSNTNAGLISMLGGEVQFTGPITNAASSGFISARDAILRTGGITNNGSLAFSNGTMDVFGDITQNVGGRITITGGGTTNFYDDVTIVGGAASVQASAAGGTVSKVVFFGSYNGGVTGGGTAFIEGDHRPGNSPSLVTFGGDVFYGALSQLFIELGGTTRGTQYDSIDVTGSVTVNGNFNLHLINAYVPLGGETFLLINNDGIDAFNGIFNGLPEGAMFAADGNLFQVSYMGGSGNDFVITAVPEPTTWVLLGASAAGAGYYWNRRRQHQRQQWEEDAFIEIE